MKQKPMKTKRKKKTGEKKRKNSLPFQSHAISQLASDRWKLTTVLSLKKVS